MPRTPEILEPNFVRGGEAYVTAGPCAAGRCSPGSGPTPHAHDWEEAAPRRRSSRRATTGHAGPPAA
eukprot:365480-Chlamydomonas_euryale.AAC.4